MLFHTWPFAVFMLIVLPGFYILRKTRLWIPWLLAASYFFFTAVGKPIYLVLVVYSALHWISCWSRLMDRVPARNLLAQYLNKPR